MKRWASVLPLLLSSLILVAGCGGGGTTGTQSSGGQAGSFGPFQTRAQGAVQTAVVSSGTATITGVAGANFTKITYNPTPNQSNCRMAFIRALNTSGLYVADFNGANYHILPNIVPSNKVSWSRDGRLVFDAMDNSVGTAQIFVANADGSYMHKISTGGLGDTQPAWSPDNFHIAFVRTGDGTGHSQIYTMTSSGGSVTHISDGTSDDDEPAWTADGTQILFRRNFDVWRVPGVGGTATQLPHIGSVDNFGLNPTQSKMILGLGGGVTYTVGFGLYDYPGLHSLGTVIVAPSNVQYFLGGWSPDGTELLFAHHDGNANTTDISMCDFNGASIQQLVFFNDSSLASPVWEPYPLPTPYVSTTGGYTVSNASSGFIYGMRGSALASFTNFVATTPATSTVTADPNTIGSGNVVYHLRADAITKLNFMNGFGALNNAITITGSVKEVLVALDATSGQVNSILPLASGKVGSIPTKQGSQTLYRGAFVGVWNDKGLNLAPHGASEVTLGRSGEVLSVK